MFKYVFSAIMLIALSCPMISAAQHCGCCEPGPTCAPKPRKKLKLVDVEREACRFETSCVTDQCGCHRSQLATVKKTVTRKKLELVEVDPCEKTCLQKMREKIAEARAKAQEKIAKECMAQQPCGCN